MIILALNIWKWSLVVFWYRPFPAWKIWQGYRPTIAKGEWPTVYCGPLKIVTGPRND